MKNIFDFKNALLGRFYGSFFSPFFKLIGKNIKILNPLKIKGFKYITLSDNVMIQNNTWLEALPLTGLNCNLIIGKNSIIGNFNHIYATNHIEIGANVLIADKVYITDNLHNYEDISLSIMNQPIKQLKKVYIGDGSWIGENVCIIGSSVGKNSVVGANSVVTKDIPSYCVAVGNPAKIIKRYNFDTKLWCKTNSIGEFVI